MCSFDDCVISLWRFPGTQLAELSSAYQLQILTCVSALLLGALQF